MEQAICQGSAAEQGLQYHMGTYEGCEVAVRGPLHALDDPFVACLGANEVFGKCVATPLPDLVENRVGIDCANFGVLNAGPEVYLRDPGLLQQASRAEAAVVQIMGAQNQSNRYYRVHPRRNDRLISPSPVLERAFPGVDFADVHFTRHALTLLQHAAPDRFLSVVDELKAVWSAQMCELLERLTTRKILIWIGSSAPPEEAWTLSRGPLFVDQQMIEALAPLVDEVIICSISERAQKDSRRGMHVPADLKVAAGHLPGPSVLREAADQLAPPLRRLGLGPRPLSRAV